MDVLFKVFFKNPMADPFVIGISSGAALGATIGLIFNLSGNIAGFTGVSVFAFLGAMMTVLVVLKIAAIQKKTTHNDPVISRYIY